MPSPARRGLARGHGCRSSAGDSVAAGGLLTVASALAGAERSGAQPATTECLAPCLARPSTMMRQQRVGPVPGSVPDTAWWSTDATLRSPPLAHQDGVPGSVPDTAG